MKAYVGQTRAANLLAQLAATDIGECVVRGKLPPRRTPWFYDNGAFEDAQQGRAFNYPQYMRDLRAMRYWTDANTIGIGRGVLKGQPMVAPDFIVLPDIVAGGAQSLEFSLDFLEETAASGRCYLAVQDGMTVEQIEEVLIAHEQIAGLFVGGTLEWKLATAAAWVALGHKLERDVHIGRVGTLDRVEWAASIGADSIDSSFPLWSRERLNGFIEAVEWANGPATCACGSGPAAPVTDGCQDPHGCGYWRAMENAVEAGGWW